MKTLPIVAIVVAAALLIGGVWLYAEPQRTMTPPILGRQPLQEQAPPTSTLPLTIPAPSQTNTTSTKPVLVAFATSTHTVGMATASPAMITEGTSTPVTVTIQITDPSLIPNGVNLLQLGATGTQPTILGVMQNTGGGLYSLQHVFTASTTGQIQLKVSAAFQASLQRVLSNLISVSVWGVLTSPTYGFTALYPPDLYNVPAGQFALQSSPGGVGIGDAPPPGGSESATGFAIGITPVPWNTSSSFDINQYLSTEYSGSYIATITSTTIGGVLGYVVTFAQEEQGGHPLAIVYDRGYVYEISYNSTIYIDGFSDQQGLNDFNQVLQHFTFN